MKIVLSLLDFIIQISHKKGLDTYCKDLFPIFSITFFIILVKFFDLFYIFCSQSNAIEYIIEH